MIYVPLGSDNHPGPGARAEALGAGGNAANVWLQLRRYQRGFLENLKVPAAG